MENPAADPATILVVDDDADILNILSTSLNSRGYNVVTALDGEDALIKARTDKPRLIILDVMMPKLNGWEVARQLKRNAATRQIKIIMLTAIGNQVNAMTSPLHGADAYVDKPFEFAQLEGVIDKLLQ